MGLPGREWDRLQRGGLAFLVLGVILTAAVLLLVHDPARRPALLGASEGFVLVGALMFLIGWNRRRWARLQPPGQPDGHFQPSETDAPTRHLSSSSREPTRLRQR